MDQIIMLPIEEEEMFLPKISATGPKHAFLAAYGLELDEEEEEEEDEESKGIASRRRLSTKMTPRLKSARLLMGRNSLSLSPTSSKSPLLKSPERRSKQLLASPILSKPRSASTSIVPIATPFPTSPPTHARKLANNIRARRSSSGRSVYIDSQSPSSIHDPRLIAYKDYSLVASSSWTASSKTGKNQTSPTSSTKNRRGYLENASEEEGGEEEEEEEEDDSSDSSFSLPSSPILFSPGTLEDAPSFQVASNYRVSSLIVQLDSPTSSYETHLNEMSTPDEKGESSSASSTYEEGSSQDGKHSSSMMTKSTMDKVDLPFQVDPIVAQMATLPNTPVYHQDTPPDLPARPTVVSSNAIVPDFNDDDDDASPAPAVPTKDEVKQIAMEKKAAVAEEKKVKAKEESIAARQEAERKILLKTVEEFEVERFLANFGKNVTKVRSKSFAEDSSSTSFPEEQFRLAALRTNGERLYMTALPMYEGMYITLRTLWKWDNPIKTASWSILYFALWSRGLLLSGLFTVVIVYVLGVRAFPPTAESIRESLQREQKRTRELQQVKAAKAEDLIKQAQEESEEIKEEEQPIKPTNKKRSRYGLAVDATRRYGKATTILTSTLADAHERIKNFVSWKSIPATWRAISLLAIAAFLTYFSTPLMMARFPGLAIGICVFVIAPIAEHRPEWLGMEWKNPIDFFLDGVPNDAQVAMEVLRRRVAAGEPLTGDNDIAQWMKVDEEEEEAYIPADTSLLDGVTATTAMSTAVDQAAAAGSNTVNWKKWKSRAAKGREMAVAGSEMLSGQRPMQFPRIAGAEESFTSQEALTGKMMLGMTKGINWGLDSIQNHSNRKLIERRLEDDEQTSSKDGIYWAVHLGSCGHVVVTPERIRFRSLFARKMSGNNDAPIEVLDPITGQLQVSEAQVQSATVRTLVDLPLKDVVQLKKTRAVNVGIWGIDGLEIRSSSGKVHQFSSLVKRDEAFNRILALAPQDWTKL